jgi:uncharacterized protein with HEPN domain
VRGDERDCALLAHVRESLDRIDEYTGRGQTRPLPGTMAEDAVLRRLETLADAAGQLSEALTSRHPGIPWREVVGFRNVLAHGYLGVDPDLVWQVVTRDLPSLRSAVDEELSRGTA